MLAKREKKKEKERESGTFSHTAWEGATVVVTWESNLARSRKMENMHSLCTKYSTSNDAFSRTSYM